LQSLTLATSRAWSLAVVVLASGAD